MLVVGHRGAPYHSLENSPSSFSEAVSAGAHRIEFDVHLSIDRHPVVMHDPTTLRTAGIDKELSKLTRSEIKLISLRNGEEILFLDEMFERYFPAIEFNIELKGNDINLAKATAAVCSQYPVDRRLVISCFHAAPLLYLSQHHSFDLACLLPEMEWPQISYLSPVVFMQDTGAKIIHPWTKLVTPLFMEQAQNRGWTVIPYCSLKGEENTHREELWSYLFGLGIDGLCTNYPRELAEWLKKEWLR